MNRTAFWNEWQSRLSTGCVLGADLYREGKFGDYRCYTVHFDCYDYKKMLRFSIDDVEAIIQNATGYAIRHFDDVEFF